MNLFGSFFRGNKKLPQCNFQYIENRIPKGFGKLPPEYVNVLTKKNIIYSTPRSKVYRFKNKVVKIILNNNQENDFYQKWKQYYNEYKHLSNKFNFIPKLIVDTCIVDSNICIVMKNTGRDLFHYLFEAKMRLDVKINLFVRTLALINELHQSNVYHGDIKPENICWDFGRDKIYLIDFEFYGNEEKQVNKLVGTFTYFPPELILYGKKGMAGDIWSMGCILYAIFTNNYIFRYDGDLNQKENYELMKERLSKNENMSVYDKLSTSKKITHALIKLDFFQSKTIREKSSIIRYISVFLSKLLQVNSKLRIKSNQIFSDKGFAELQILGMQYKLE